MQHLTRTTSYVIQYIMLVYDIILSIDALAKSFYYIQEELITLRSLSNEEKVLVNAAKIICITYFFIYDFLILKYLTIRNRNGVLNFHIKYCVKREHDLKHVKIKKQKTK